MHQDTPLGGTTRRTFIRDVAITGTSTAAALYGLDASGLTDVVGDARAAEALAPLSEFKAIAPSSADVFETLLRARPDGAHDHHHHDGRLRAFTDHVSADFLFMGKFVVAGAALAAAAQTIVPQSVFAGVLASPLVGALVLMGAAFVLSLCSEADAFVAVSFIQFPPGLQLAFLAFGPILDIKLALLYSATFGRGFVLRLAVIAVPTVLLGSLLAGALL